MPHIDGLEFIGAVRGLFPEAVIIVVSGKGEDQLDAALSAGAQAALSKPIHPQKLLKAIAEVSQDSLGRSEEDVGTVARSDEPLILIVEDNPDDAELIQAALKKNLAQSRTHLVFHGWEAQAYLAGWGQVLPNHRILSLNFLEVRRVWDPTSSFRLSWRPSL